MFYAGQFMRPLVTHFLVGKTEHFFSQPKLFNNNLFSRISRFEAFFSQLATDPTENNDVCTRIIAG